MNDEYNLQDVVGQLMNMEVHFNNISCDTTKINNNLEVGLNNIDNTLIRIADALEIIAKK